MKHYALNSIKIAELSQISNKNFYGKTVVTAGWGKANNGTLPRFLQSATLKILSNTECEDRLRKLTRLKVPVHQRLLCSYGQNFVLMQMVFLLFIMNLK